MCLWNFLYKITFLFHTCQFSPHCHPTTSLDPLTSRQKPPLSGTSSKSLNLETLDAYLVWSITQMTWLYKTALFPIQFPYKWFTGSPRPPLSISLLVFEHTHTHFPTAGVWDSKCHSRSPFISPYLFPFSEWANKHVAYLFIYLFAQLLAGSGCSQQPQQQSFCPLNDSQAGGCQIDQPNVKDWLLFYYI